MRHNIQYSENEVINEIFNDYTFYKQKYKLYWCDTCQCAAIRCNECGNTSCNGKGCDSCAVDADFIDFNKNNTRIESYLTPDEVKTHIKIQMIQKNIADSLSRGESKIDFKRLIENGQLTKSQIDAISDLL